MKLKEPLSEKTKAQPKTLPALTDQECQQVSGGGSYFSTRTRKAHRVSRRQLGEILIVSESGDT